ncbi:MAG: 1-acyl-sn-glycerol-3-phosphate acyltransferase [Synergistales bacterium]|nr:1-acyl-sn-glycerol-3-phosphate acyltransferase [Synergistales bacterium]
MGRLLSAVVYAAAKVFCFLVLKIYNRLRISGKGSLPREHPYIVVSNHCSNLDPVVVGVSCPVRLRYLAKEELFGVPLLGPLIRVLGASPVRRDDGGGSGTALRHLLGFLEQGEHVLLFPEGRRSRDGRLGSLEGGVALLAKRSGLPVVPVVVQGTHRAMPMGGSGIRPASISVQFGEPLYFSDHGTGREARQAFLDALEQRMRELLGEAGA